MRKKHKSITVGFIALGCPKNIVDSEKMLAEIAQAGLVITTEPENADVVVINTCGFIAPAKAEALEAIDDAVAWKTTGTVKKVIVAGCLPERLGRELLDQADGIDAIIGLGQRDAIAQIIKNTLISDEKAAFLEHACETTRAGILDDRARLLINSGHWAYLRISEGCDHSCSFCTIPTIRGRFLSKPKQLVLDEAADLASAGVVEPSLHDFRRAFCLAMLREGIDIFTLAKLMGHESTAVLQRYLKQTNQDTEQAHRRAGPVDNANL